MTSNASNIADWICDDCGPKHGRVIEGHLATFHEPDGTYGCGWCGRKDVHLTEPRDYGITSNLRNRGKCSD